MEECDKSKVKKILVVSNDNISDFVCATPCLEALRAHFPAAYIAILACRVTEDVVIGNPYVDEVFVYDKTNSYGNSLVAWWKQYLVLRAIRSKRFDLAIGIRSEFSFSQAWLVYASGAHYRLGIAPEEKNKRFSFFYNIHVNKVRKTAHEVERSLHVLRRIGVNGTQKQKRLTITIPPEKIKEAGLFLAGHNLDRRKPIVCVNVVSGMEEQQHWNLANYTLLIEKLAANKVQTVVTSNPAGIGSIPKILAPLDYRVPVYSGSLKNFAAIVSLCNILVTLQGDFMHVGAATGTRTIGLFGKNNPAIRAPWGPQHRVLKKGNDVNLISAHEVFSTIQDVLGG